MSENVETNDTLPEGYYGLVLHGLPGHPKTAAGLEGKDVTTGKMWQASIYSSPDNPSDSLMVRIPTSVPFVRVVSADEWLEELTVDSFATVPAGRL